jgi:hypothetical protein
MTWSTLTFGKHQGKTLPQVLFSDPDWFFWAVEEGVFEKRAGSIKAEAQDLDRKARAIKIPENDAGKLIVEYLVHVPTKKFSHFEIVASDRPLHEGASPAFRSELIDMSVPRRIAAYDKLGCKNLLKSLKHVVFGNKSARVTKARAEKFFDDSSNFA